jgi:diphosphomevalonate decarboxylase
MQLKKYKSGLFEGRTGWQCPSNIALVKYWGKKSGQIPANPSISLTLSESCTKMVAEYDVSDQNAFTLEFTFAGKQNPAFAEKMTRYLLSVKTYLPFIDHLHLKIDSDATFPHSAGIASSASAFGAIALVLCSIEQKVEENPDETRDFYRRASFLARLGSGSACRSVYGGAVLWGYTAEFPGSDDEFAIPIAGDINPEFKHYRDSILVVSSEPKSMPSTAGHKSMEDHPFASCRYLQANNNIIHMLDVLHGGNQYGFNEIIENESLSLHALMMSSCPGYILMKPETIKIIGKIQDYRSQTGVPVGFTLDAGANVHVLYPFSFDATVKEFIHQELEKYCEANKVIHDHVGKGPLKLY